MAVYAQTSVAIAANELLISGFANQVELTTSADKKDVTTFGSGGYEQSIVGLGSYAANLSGFQDFTNGPGTYFSSAGLGTLDTFSLSIPGSTAGDPAYFGTCRDTSMTEFGAVGEVAPFSINWAGTSRLVRGVSLHPAAARTAALANGTTVAFTAPTATQALHASFHVHSVTGSGSIVMAVRTDDNSGMTTPTFRVGATLMDVGHSFQSLAGALAGETHMAIQYSISGFTSVTFSVFAGVGTP